MSPETKALYEFGRFRCDPAEHLLFCEGKAVSLAPKAFEILIILIKSNGRLLTKDETDAKGVAGHFCGRCQPDNQHLCLAQVVGGFARGPAIYRDSTQTRVPVSAPVRSFMMMSKLANRCTPLRLPGWCVPISPWPRRVALSAALLLVAIMVVVLLSTRSAKLTDKDTVVLADFANSTGDPVFDDALRQGLSSQLEQSPFLNLLSEERVAQTLALMSQPQDVRLSHQLGLEVCQRTASTAVLDGAIAQVGTHYLLTLKAINCSNGDSLGSAEEQAADKDHVLDALGKVASKMRSQLGESLASVQKYDAPPESVTTPSLEALKAYSLGYQAMVVKSDYVGAIPLFQRAISFDPKFAMAYARMGTSYADLNETVRSAESVRRAYELREHVSEREKFYIASHYEMFVTGNLEAARKVYELSAQTYPRDTRLGNLGFLYSELGNYDKALAEYKEDLKLNPEKGNAYADLAGAYLRLNRLDEALATAREAQAHNIDVPEVHLHPLLDRLPSTRRCRDGAGGGGADGQAGR